MTAALGFNLIKPNPAQIPQLPVGQVKERTSVHATADPDWPIKLLPASALGLINYSGLTDACLSEVRWC